MESLGAIGNSSMCCDAAGHTISCSPPQMLVFYGGKNDYIFRVHPDGNVEVNPDLTLDDASKAFWEYVNNQRKNYLL